MRENQDTQTDRKEKENHIKAVGQTENQEESQQYNTKTIL